ncbi:MAG TPA: hypothetical protein VFA60_13330 [Terriglobales bacterium]|nr:hypothetical protein [Terriglobales bacterium]
MDNNVLGWFVIVAAVAIVVQMGILIAMYVSMRKTGQAVQGMVAQAQPVISHARTFLDENGPRVNSILTDAAHSATVVRAQVERLDATVTDIVDRTRLQVIRADELVTTTLNRVEDTTDMVHRTVISPVRTAAALIQGITAGAQALVGVRQERRRRKAAGTGGDEEMFI